VTGVSPNTGPAAGGTSVVITGSNLSGVMAVKFGSTNASSFTLTSETQITASSPAGTGTVDVTVTTAGGTSATSAADRFTYTVATTPSSPTSCNGNFSSTFNGSLTISSGQTCTFTGGGTTGGVNLNGGSLALSGATIATNVTVSGGGSFSIGASQIGGNLTATNLPAGATANQLCGATIKGNVTYQSNGLPLQAGAASGCPGNTIGGNITISGNSAATVIANTLITGNITDANNTASTQVAHNTVDGNLVIQNNTGASTEVSVTNNIVKGNLTCAGNYSTGTTSDITGSGNTAQAKQGQCANF